MDICVEIVEFTDSFLHNKFPVLLAYGYLICFIEFPIEIFMRFLIGIIACQGGQERYAIEVIRL